MRLERVDTVVLVLARLEVRVFTLLVVVLRLLVVVLRLLLILELSVLMVPERIVSFDISSLTDPTR